MDSIKPIFEQILRENLTYLEGQNYQLHSVEILKNTKTIVAQVQNIDANRMVIFKYTPSGFFRVTIQEFNTPELAWDDYLSTNSMHVFSSQLSHSKASIEQQLKACLNEVNALLKAKFQDVLDGHEFRGDPIDWNNQK